MVGGAVREAIDLIVMLYAEKKEPRGRWGSSSSVVGTPLALQKKGRKQRSLALVGLSTIFQWVWNFSITLPLVWSSMYLIVDSVSESHDWVLRDYILNSNGLFKLQTT